MPSHSGVGLDIATHALKMPLAADDRVMKAAMPDFVGGRRGKPADAARHSGLESIHHCGERRGAVHPIIVVETNEGMKVIGHDDEGIQRHVVPKLSRPLPLSRNNLTDCRVLDTARCQRAEERLVALRINRHEVPLAC